MIVIKNKFWENNPLALIELLCNKGWSIRNGKGMVEYLPVGDIDSFDWEIKKLSDDDIKDIVTVKQNRKETIGFYLFYEKTSTGIGLLSKEKNDIIISVDVNRQKISDTKNALTDFSWYFDHVISLLAQNRMEEFSYRFEDYIEG